MTEELPEEAEEAPAKLRNEEERISHENEQVEDRELHARKRFSAERAEAAGVVAPTYEHNELADERALHMEKRTSD